MQLLSQLNIWMSGCVVEKRTALVKQIHPHLYSPQHLAHICSIFFQQLCTLQGFLMWRQWKRRRAWGLGWGWCIRCMQLRLPVCLPLLWILRGPGSGCRGPGGRSAGVGTRKLGWQSERVRRAWVWCGWLLDGHSSRSCHWLGCISVARGQMFGIRNEESIHHQQCEVVECIFRTLNTKEQRWEVTN